MATTIRKGQETALEALKPLAGALHRAPAG